MRRAVPRTILSNRPAPTNDRSIHLLDDLTALVKLRIHSYLAPAVAKPKMMVHSRIRLRIACRKKVEGGNLAVPVLRMLAAVSVEINSSGVTLALRLSL